MSVNSFQELISHHNHQIVCAYYGASKKKARNAALECETCGEVLLDFDRDELPGPDEVAIKRGKKHYFTIQISGEGKTAQEAWDEAVECFAADPGVPPDPPEKKRKKCPES